MLSTLPVTRLSMATTSSPRSSSASQRCEPRNPAPPVTTIRPSIRPRPMRRCVRRSRGGRSARRRVEQVAGVDDPRASP